MSFLPASTSTVHQQIPSPTARTAWMKTEHGVAIICAWCEDKALAEARAKAGGLTLSHGICPECAREKMGVEITPESFAAEKIRFADKSLRAGTAPAGPNERIVYL